MMEGQLRTNTNDYVHRRAAYELNKNNLMGQKYKRLSKLSSYYELQRRTLIADVVKAEADNPIKEVVIEGDGLKQLDYGFRRWGGKRNNWWEKGIHYYWNVIKKDLQPHLRYAQYDEHNQEHRNCIGEAAQQGIGTRRQTK